MVETHYSDLATKPFFGELVTFMQSGPVVAMVWKGAGMVAAGREIMAGVRDDFATDAGCNAIHASDSVESARREMSLWFGR